MALTKAEREIKYREAIEAFHKAPEQPQKWDCAACGTQRDRQDERCHKCGNYAAYLAHDENKLL